jgi:hypothetical protein
MPAEDGLASRKRVEQRSQLGSAEAKTSTCCVIGPFEANILGALGVVGFSVRTGRHE